jgi:hypothetical protein
VADDGTAQELEARRASSELIRRAGAPPGASVPPPALTPVTDRLPVAPLPGPLARRIRARVGGGEPLPGALRGAVEPRLGALGDVRLHSGDEALTLARALRARAFAIGRDVFLRDGMPPRSMRDPWDVVHELAHVRQLRDAAAEPVVMRAPEEPELQPRYPTAAERARILEILSPQRQAAEASSGALRPLSDPEGFRVEMRAVVDGVVDRILPGARAREASALSLGGEPVVGALGQIAETALRSRYGAYMSAAVHTPEEQALRGSERLREHLAVVTTTLSGETDARAREWVESIMTNDGAAVLHEHQVMIGEDSAGAARDRHFFEAVRDEILAARLADIRTVTRFHPGFTHEGTAFIQTRLIPRGDEPERDTVRRGRWAAMGTILHEMLHISAHERFRDAVDGLEHSRLASEGFTELFTRPVYEALVDRARSDRVFRASVEGVDLPREPPAAPERTQYERDETDALPAARRILETLGENEVNLREAYFLGRVELIGLGGWNPETAARLRFPGNTLGFGALIAAQGGGLFRIDYGRVLLGRGGDLQLSLGPTVSYMTDGQRLGLGGGALVQYSWPHLYVRARIGVEAEVGLARPASPTLRLDVIPGVEAGARLGVARVGVRGDLVVPVVGGPIDERVVRLGVGIGLSFDL